MVACGGGCRGVHCGGGCRGVHCGGGGGCRSVDRGRLFIQKIFG